MTNGATINVEGVHKACGATVALTCPRPRGPRGRGKCWSTLAHDGGAAGGAASQPLRRSL